MVKDAIIVGIGVAIIWGSLMAVFGTQNPFYVVSSGSMVPALQVYDIIVVRGNAPSSRWPWATSSCSTGRRTTTG